MFRTEMRVVQEKETSWKSLMERRVPVVILFCVDRCCARKSKIFAGISRISEKYQIRPKSHTSTMSTFSLYHMFSHRK